VENQKRQPVDQIYFWRVAAEGYPARVVQISPPQGVPIPSGGAVIVSTVGGEFIPAIFGAGNFTGILRNGEPMFRWVVAPEPPPFSFDLFPRTFSLFANGARVLGIDVLREPKAGEDLSLTLVWKIERGDPGAEYSFSIRLVDEYGNRFGQTDGLSLNAGLWRAGDTVINRFTLPVSADYPNNSKPVAQVLMYAKDSAPVVDEGGYEVAQQMTLVPDETVRDDLGWFEFHPAGRYDTLTARRFFARFNEIELLGFNVPQTEVRAGDSIPIALYWRATQPPPLNYHLFVHLRAADGSLVGQSDKLDPAESPTTHWITGGYLLDSHTLTIAPDTLPGQYQLFVGLWEGSAGRVMAYGEDGAALGDSVPLGITVTVRP
ncbi:MAG: hypothetical protein AAB342_06795, partial [Chloroflexota bacterium]